MRNLPASKAAALQKTHVNVMVVGGIEDTT